MELADFLQQNLISVRAYNVCRRNNLHFADQILMYYDQHGSFMGLPNCGKTSDVELKAFCYSLRNFPNEFKNQNNLNFNGKNEVYEKPFNEELNLFGVNPSLNGFSSTIEQPGALNTVEIAKKNEEDLLFTDLSSYQIECLNHFILTSISSLNPRARNAIKLHLNNNLSINSFVEKKLLIKNYPIGSLKNIGKRSIPEIKTFLENIRKQSKEAVGNITEESAPENAEQNEVTQAKNINTLLLKDTFHNLSPEILISDSIFKIVDYLIHSNYLFPSNHSEILIKSIEIFKNHKEVSDSEISEEVQLSRERVRQVKKKFLNKLFDKLSFTSLFKEDLLQKYNIEIENEFLQLDSEQADFINILNKTNFSQEFLTYILFVHLSPQFSLVGNIEDVMAYKNITPRNRHKWTNLFLIKKKLIKIYNFEGCWSNRILYITKLSTSLIRCPKILLVGVYSLPLVGKFSAVSGNILPFSILRVRTWF